MSRWTSWIRSQIGSQVGVFAFGLSLTALTLGAQEPPPPDPPVQDPQAQESQPVPTITPARRVAPAPAAAQASGRTARLSFLDGTVTVVRADNSGSDPAQLNMPLAEGVRVETARNGQAEVEFEDGSVVRLTPLTSIALTSLNLAPGELYQTTVTLLRGLMYGELRASTRYTYAIDAGSDRVTPTSNATFRVNFDQPSAVIADLDGTVRVERGGASAGGLRQEMHAGETLSSEGDSGKYQVSEEAAQDSWDNWNESRDQAAADDAANRTSARDGYAGDAGYGWSDLDANGSWYDVPGQGRVWQPAGGDASGFDPYADGSWVTGVSGYVWASGYTWGWLPYRCGSWGYWGGFGWGWSPAASCGLRGGRGGYGISILHPPPGYHRPFRPIRPIGPGNGRPIPVHGGPVRDIGRSFAREPKTFAGQRIDPLRPIGSFYTPRGGSAIGATLRRDFPVDQTHHRPVMGVAADPGRPSGNGWREVRQRPGVPANGTAPGVILGSQGNNRGASGIVRVSPGTIPGSPRVPGTSGTPGTQGTPGTPGTPANPGYNSRSDGGWSGRPDRGDRPSRPDGGWSGRPDRADRPSRPEAPARPGGGPGSLHGATQGSEQGPATHSVPQPRNPGPPQRIPQMSRPSGPPPGAAPARTGPPPAGSTPSRPATPAPTAPDASPRR